MTAKDVLNKYGISDEELLHIRARGTPAYPSDVQ